jgi:hypothetical protein
LEDVSGVAEIDRVVVGAVGEGVSAVPRATSANRTCEKNTLFRIAPVTSFHIYYTAYMLKNFENREGTIG